MPDHTAVFEDRTDHCRIVVQEIISRHFRTFQQLREVESFRCFGTDAGNVIIPGQFIVKLTVMVVAGSCLQFPVSFPSSFWHLCSCGYCLTSYICHLGLAASICINMFILSKCFRSRYVVNICPVELQST